MKTFKTHIDITLGWPELIVPAKGLFQHDGKDKVSYKGKTTKMLWSDIPRYLEYGYISSATATASELAAQSGCVEEEIHSMNMEIAPAPGAEEIEIADTVVIEEEVYEEVFEDEQGTEEDVDIEFPPGCDIEIAPNPATIKDPAPAKTVKTSKPAPKKPVKIVEPVALDTEDDGEEGEAEVISCDDEPIIANGITIKGSEDAGGMEEVISFDEITTPGVEAKPKPSSQRKITKQPRPSR